HSHITAKEWHGFRRHKPGQPRPYNPQNGQPDRLLDAAFLNAQLSVLISGSPSMGCWPYDFWVSSHQKPLRITTSSAVQRINGT
ncbi:hypothetical protein, partial [Komagataeibacter oboediens]|uniref:hypothetical protein n=1 Tax=Komagataeibacter oboediens TaxID=65958 RepID=UPI001C6523ED